MFALFGLLGVVLAGLAIDFTPSEQPDDDPDSQEGDETDQPSGDETWMTPQEFLGLSDPAEGEGEESAAPGAEILPQDRGLGLANPASLQPSGGEGLAQSADMPQLATAGLDLIGTAGDDALMGQSGHDLLQGGAGQDQMAGGAGNDSLTGEDGVDRVWGDEGDDRLWGGGGDDSLWGDTGADSLFGGDGNDLSRGGEGADWLEGGAGADQLEGGAGNDGLLGGAGADQLEGGEGNDLLIAGDGAADPALGDMLNGGAGDDRLLFGAGDWASGGEGADSFELQNFSADGSDMAVVTDFAPETDGLIVHYDPQIHPSPALSYEAQQDGGRLLLDGVPIATFPGLGALDPATIQLRPA